MLTRSENIILVAATEMSRRRQKVVTTGSGLSAAVGLGVTTSARP
jgi:hypothetical protein